MLAPSLASNLRLAWRFWRSVTAVTKFPDSEIIAQRAPASLARGGAIERAQMLQRQIMHSTAAVEQCQAIRWRVFCCERGYLPAPAPGVEIEQDEFDAIATHLAVADQSGQLVGALRLVPHSDAGFPLQRYALADIPAQIAARTLEVSRLAAPRGAPREVGLALYQAGWRAAKRMGATHFVAVISPALRRVFRALDMPWRPIGPSVDFGGLVQPHLASIAEYEAVQTPAARRFLAGVRDLTTI